MANGEQFADLVFEGGGVKGIGLAGAFAALQERHVTPKGLAGTSAGAITAALVAAGYSSTELDTILKKIPFADFKDEGPEDRIPLIGRGVSLLLKRGVYEGKFFQRWIAELLEAKAITKFGQLVDEGADNPKHRYRLQVIASDVTHRRMLVLPNDAGHLGIDPDDLEIAYAVRMSMSIPIFFQPVVHRNRETGEDHVIVDGGMLSNFPVWLFDREGQEGSLVDYVKSLALTMMDAHDRLYLEKATYARTIPIPTLGVGTTEFDITDERVSALYESGHQAASDFLDHWNFPAYIAEFRRGKEHSRRKDLLDTLEASKA